MTLNIKAKKLTSLIEQTIGLMGKSKIYPVYFETRYGIHTAFVKEPILIVILDGEKVHSKRIVNPWRAYFWDPKYYRVLELPTDFDKKIKIGDIIKI